MRTLRLVGIALLVGAAAARAEIAPSGGELQVNTFTRGAQEFPDVAMTPAGDFIVVWDSAPTSSLPGQDGSAGGIYGQRYARDGSRRGGEFQVNTYTTGPQNAPVVAARANGDFVVVWNSGSYYADGPDGSATGVFLRRFDADGVPQTDELQVNTYTQWEQTGPSVAMAPDGSAVVVWQSGFRAHQDGDSRGIFGQRFDPAGTRAGDEFQVNTYTTGDQDRPEVGMDAAGRFVVAWESGDYDAMPDGDLTGVFARRFDAAGAPAGPEFQVNTYTTGYQSNPAIAVQPGGGFVVVWESRGYYSPPQDGSDAGVFGQRFDAGGQRLGAEFLVNTVTADDQRSPAIATDGLGNFVVSWTTGGFGDEVEVAARHFTADGTPLGDEIQVNTYTTNDQRIPSIAAGGSGNFVIAWQSGAYSRPGQDGDSVGAFARRMHTTAFAAPIHVRGARLALVDDPSDPSRRRLDVSSDDRTIGLGDGRGGLDDPTVSGANLRVRSGAFDDTYSLPAANWRATRDGWQYADPRLSAGPIRRARIRAGRLASASGIGAQLQHDLTGSPEPVFVIMQTGAAGQRWCMRFGGATRYVPSRVFKAHDAATPDDCPI